MEPLFDRDRALHAWMKDRINIFDLTMGWIAFVKNDHVFTAADLNWLGPAKNSSLLDRTGKAVLWIPGGTVDNTFQPVRPMRPVKPIPPIRPIYPVRPLPPPQPSAPQGGWSRLAFHEWLTQ